MAMLPCFIKFLYEGMILCIVCSVSEYIKGKHTVFSLENRIYVLQMSDMK